MKRAKRLLAVLISFFILAGTTAMAEDTSEDKPVDTTTTTPVLEESQREGKTEEEIYEMEAANEETATQNAHDMKIVSNEWKEWPQGPATYGEAAIVMDAGSGAVLYAKNIDGKAYPASITKVLTALVALENGKLDDKITITEPCIDFLEYGDAHIGMTPGEEITLNDALHALLLASANEIAYAIAANVGQGYDWFIDQMNTRAKELGAVNTHFVNTNGLQDPEHYTTARDMALITRELFENHPEFKTISETLQYTIPPTNLQAEERTFQQKHKMFYDWSEYYYENVVAGKTGYTEEALNTLVTCADDGNMELICVVLKTHGKNVYTDTRALFDYGFSNFHKVSIKENEKSEDFDKIAEDAYVVLPENVVFKDLKQEIVPDDKDNKTGTVNYIYEGNKLGSASVEFSSTYIKKNSPKVEAKDKKSEKKKEKVVPVWIKWTLIAAGILIVLTIIWFLIALSIRKKRREERRRKKQRRRKRR